jgi:hypothetical protein
VFTGGAPPICRNGGEENRAMSLRKNPKQTSLKVASKAAKILRDPSSTKKERSVAASDLAQTRPRGAKKSR